MRILQLCKKFPYPLKDGEAIAVSHLSRSLDALGCEVTLLCMNTRKHYFDKNDLPQDFNHYKEIHAVEVDTDVKLGAAIANLFSDKSYHIQRFVSQAFEQKLTDLLRHNEYDIIQLETLYLAPYIPCIRRHSKAKIAMRAHNVEHEIWDRINQNTRLQPKKWYLKHLSTKLRRFEIAQLFEYDLMVSITQKDLDYFRGLGYKKDAVVVPIGLDHREYPPDNQSYKKDLSLSFIGSLDWMPNQEGLRWFLENIWEKLLRRYPQLSLHVAGRNTPDWIKKIKEQNVSVYGEVPDASEFINKHSIMVVPLLSGSGMRAKVLEGMALGKVVLTTSMGLEGVDARHKEEVLIADTVEEFIDCIDFCYRSNGQLSQIGHNARQFISTNYDNLHIAQHLLEAYKSIVGWKVEKSTK
ncbi:MAG: glycosyltransferase family 4 protein [Bacteroidota bacterium]